MAKKIILYKEGDGSILKKKKQFWAHGKNSNSDLVFNIESLDRYCSHLASVCHAKRYPAPPTYWYIWERNFHSRGKVYIPANINRRSSINQRAVFLETCPPKYLLELSSFALLTGRLSVSLWTPPPQNDNLGLDKHLGGELPQWLLSSSGVLLSFLCSAFLLKEQFTSSALCLLELGKKHNCPFVTIYCLFPGGSTEVYKEHSRSLLLSRAFWVHCFSSQLTTTYY